MPLSSIRPRCGREGLLRRFVAAVGSVVIVLVTMVSLPWATPSADAATGELTVPLGDTSAQIAYVRNTEGVDAVTETVNDYPYTVLPWEWAYSRACVRYSPAGGGYYTDVVKGSSGAYATVGYGRQELNGACPDFEGDPSWGRQSSLGFQPSNTTSIKTGQVFLVGMMRHVNRPIYSDTSSVTNPARPETIYYGSFNVRTAGTIEANFPWVEKDTINTCTGKIGSDGKLVIDDYGKESQRIPTPYAYDSRGNVGRYGGGYVYMYQNGRLVWFDGYMTQDYTDKNGRTCSDDILDIRSDRSDTAWTDPNTGISYKLKLWGFVNNGSSDNCQAQLSKAESAGLEERFITRERAISYGCLYGSLEQERPVTFAKDVKADPSVQGSLTIPQFSYVNASPKGTYGYENWGTPSGLTPTWDNEAVDPKTYTLLAPNDAATVQEVGTAPQGAIDRDAGEVRRTGWFLRGITCTAGTRQTPLLRRDGATRLDQSDSVNLQQQTVRLDETQLAEHQDELGIKCVWHNEYVVAPGRLTLVNVVDAGSAKPTEWTLSATPTVSGLFGQKTVTGASGSAQVTRISTAGGTYSLTSGSGPEGYTQNGPWACTDDDGSDVPVNGDGQFVLGEGRHVTCTVHQKPLQTPVSADKTVDGASDAATAGSYSLSYSCTPGPDGRGTSTGRISVDAKGGAVDLPAQHVGATCTITEDARDAKGLKQPASAAGGSVSWKDPAAFKVVTNPGRQEKEIASTAVAPANGNAGGVTFTVPDSTEGNVRVKVVNSVVPHAGIAKTFTKVTKSAEKVDGRNTFDQTYTITVTNPSAKADLTYDLNDAWQVPTGVTVHKVSISGGDITGTETPQAGVPYARTGITLPAGQKHTYTVVLNVSGPDVGLPGVQGTCQPGAVGQGRAVYNKASVTTKGDDQPKEAAACGSLPPNPRFKAAKAPLDVIRNADGTFTAGYTVTVTNTSQAASPVVADLTDTPQLPAGTRLSRVRVLEKGVDAQGTTVPAINGATGTLDGPITLIRAGSGGTLAAASPGGEGGSRTFTVQMTFTVREDAQGFVESDFQCGHQRADGRPSGLVNTIAMEGDADGEDNNHACLSTSGKLKFSKEITVQPTSGSTFDVVYTVSVVNEGSLTAATGPINDTPSFAPGLVPTTVKVQRETDRPRTVTQQADGSYRLADNERLHSGLRIRYTVTFTVRIDPSVQGYSEDLLSCTTENGRLVPGRGLYNKVVPEPGKDSDTRPDHDVACANVSPDAGRRVLSIVKTGSQGPLDDAAFDIYPMDPATPGAKPLPDGVTFTGGKGTGTFTTTGLAINREYWLVETRAPAGHQLMAKPARFKVTDSGIELINPDPGGSALTVSRSGAGRAEDTITVRDVQIGTLPLSGGRGIGMNVAIGIAAITGAGLLALRRRKTSSPRHAA
ncbi:SpaA isopeptide-forming pilin-related protein [Actinomyces sp. ZJ308]|uniref:SpaA isopeptide-forming pilin-related protein n=1 Tax=Actinomyces sp. ZJ308 TaxID=2708342 RepID=UPI0014226F2C|nr:SpaA isopeptide-forming pilin-related protein [Actinomyces sp. ZJ308]